jgi:hypothetical protein
LDQYLGNLRPCELGRKTLTLAKHFPHLRTAEEDVIRRIMGACLLGHHLITSLTKKGVVEKDGLDFKFVPIDGIENPLCIICSIITAYTGVIPSDNDMGTSVIFSNNGVMDGLPGPCIPHGHGKDHQGNPVPGIIVFQQYLVAPHPHIRGNVI